MTVQDRVETLKRLPRRGVFEVFNEDSGVEFTVEFVPISNVLIINRSDFSGEPPVAITYSEFITKGANLKLNPKNKLDQVIKLIVDTWDGVSDAAKMSFYNQVPLNSMYIRGDYI